MGSTITLLFKSKISNFKPSSVCVQTHLCQTWSETPKIFSRRGSYCEHTPAIQRLPIGLIKNTTNLEKINTRLNDSNSVVPRQIFNPYCHLLISTAFIVLNRVGNWITRVNYCSTNSGILRNVPGLVRIRYWP